MVEPADFITTIGLSHLLGSRKLANRSKAARPSVCQRTATLYRSRWDNTLATTRTNNNNYYLFGE